MLNYARTAEEFQDFLIKIFGKEIVLGLTTIKNNSLYLQAENYKLNKKIRGKPQSFKINDIDYQDKLHNIKIPYQKTGLITCHLLDLNKKNSLCVNIKQNFEEKERRGTKARREGNYNSVVKIIL